MDAWRVGSSTRLPATLVLTKSRASGGGSNRGRRWTKYVVFATGGRRHLGASRRPYEGGLWDLPDLQDDFTN